MKKPVLFFLVIALLVSATIAARAYLVPLVYRIKEPYFAMPLAIYGTGGDTRVGSVLALPVRNDEYGEGAFGAKRKGDRRHKGIDLAADYGTPVCAAKTGRAKAYFYPHGYGHLVVIDHPDGWHTRYGHLDSVAVGTSRWVRRGDVIGSVGKSGNANYDGMITHLHFEIWRNGKPLDPARFLVKAARSDG
jgi:murein DD-endopeptidase MepM/ murein hydrolase activator NlpD